MGIYAEGAEFHIDRVWANIYHETYTRSQGGMILQILGDPEENDDSDAPILRPAARRPLRSVAIIKLNSGILSSWAVTSLFLTIKRGWAEHAQIERTVVS